MIKLNDLKDDYYIYYGKALQTLIKIRTKNGQKQFTSVLDFEYYASFHKEVYYILDEDDPYIIEINDLSSEDAKKFLNILFEARK